MSELRTPPPAARTPTTELVDRLVEEMAEAWQRGDRTAAECYLDRHPELQNDAEGAIRLVYEEVCLRKEGGQEITLDELSSRFPQWAGELMVLLDCDHLMRLRLAPPRYPRAGESLGELRLVAELGRGTGGRAYLAVQPALADRPVVLKVVPRLAREHLSLARLQHTHIIPLYGIYDFPEQNLSALCMPFLGGATLARVLELLRGEPVERRTGRSLVNALDAAEKDYPARLPRGGAYLSALAEMSYVEAVCALGACLADGLQYAHERGLVHLDLKPSNVLLTADAQPLLLDFHLALGSLPAGGVAPEGLGGTPGFMSPEQESGCAAARRGRPIPALIDHRSDIYSLGQLLYVVLSGEDGATALGRLALHRRNRQVSVGLSDVIHKCLAPNPDDRYASAPAVAADLRCHVAHLLLRGAPNRSLRERWHKWRLRRPNAPLWAALVLALTGTGAMLAGGAVGRYREAQAALIEGQAHMQRGAYAEAVNTLARGVRQVGVWPGGGSLAAQLDRELRRARRASSAADLHTLAERLRYLVGADMYSPRELRMLEACCRKAWEVRGTATDPTVRLDGSSEEQIRADLLDLTLLWSDLRERLFQRGELGEDREETRAILAEAEALSGSGVSLARERWLQSSPADSPASSTRTLASQSSWEHVALGQSLLRSGNLAAAMEELKCASELRPSDFWAHFYRGVCAYRRTQYAEAVHSFGVAIALAPTSPECYYNRGLAYAAWGKSGEAIRDYDHALSMAPELGAAALNRGILQYQNGRHAQAQADLEQALQSGVDPAAAHYGLALVHLALRDRAAAQRHVNRALEHRPSDARIQALQQQLRASN